MEEFCLRHILRSPLWENHFTSPLFPCSSSNDLSLVQKTRIPSATSREGHDKSSVLNTYVSPCICGKRNKSISFLVQSETLAIT